MLLCTCESWLAHKKWTRMHFGMSKWPKYVRNSINLNVISSESNRRKASRRHFVVWRLSAYSFVLFASISSFFLSFFLSFSYWKCHSFSVVYFRTEFSSCFLESRRWHTTKLVDKQTSSSNIFVVRKKKLPFSHFAFRTSVFVSIFRLRWLAVVVIRFLPSHSRLIMDSFVFPHITFVVLSARRTFKHIINVCCALASQVKERK